MESPLTAGGFRSASLAIVLHPSFEDAKLICDGQTVSLDASSGTLTCSAQHSALFGWENCDGYHLARLFRATPRGRWKVTARAVPHYGLPRPVRGTYAFRAARSVGI